MSTTETIIAAGVAVLIVVAVICWVRWHRSTDPEANLRVFYASYMAAVRGQADANIRDSIPDDEWLTVIKARVDARLRKDEPPAPDVEETWYPPVPWEIVEAAR